MSDEPDPDVERVRKIVVDLGEHFDTVQIFTTKYTGKDGGTDTVQIGTGNFFARWGQIHEWLLKNEEIARTKVRGPEEEI